MRASASKLKFVSEISTECRFATRLGRFRDGLFLLSGELQALGTVAVHSFADAIDERIQPAHNAGDAERVECRGCHDDSKVSSGEAHV